MGNVDESRMDLYSMERKKQKKQKMLLDSGELTNQVAKANAAYGFRQGSEKPLSREQAMILNVFSSQLLAEYMK